MPALPAGREHGQHDKGRPVGFDAQSVRGIFLGGFMTTLNAELEAQVLSLDPADRARLLERLIASFEPTDADVQDSWIAEAQRREAEVLAGKVSLVPGHEALERVRARVA